MIDIEDLKARLLDSAENWLSEVDTRREAAEAIEQLQRDLADAIAAKRNACRLLDSALERNEVMKGELEEARRDAGRLEIALDPRRWTQKLSDAWNLNIPDTVKAFRELRDAARQQQGIASQFNFVENLGVPDGCVIVSNGDEAKTIIFDNPSYDAWLAKRGQQQG